MPSTVTRPVSGSGHPDEQAVDLRLGVEVEELAERRTVLRRRVVARQHAAGGNQLGGPLAVLGQVGQTALGLPAELWQTVQQPIQQPIQQGQVMQAGIGIPALIGIGAGIIAIARTIDWGQITSMVQAGNIVGAVRYLIALVGAKKLLSIIGAAVALGLLAIGVYNLIKNSKEAKAGRRRRRFSIGYNPRLGTLIKVAKHTDKLTRKFAQRMRHAGLIRSPGRHTYYPQRGRRDLTVVR